MKTMRKNTKQMLEAFPSLESRDSSLDDRVAFEINISVSNNVANIQVLLSKKSDVF